MSIQQLLLAIAPGSAPASGATFNPATKGSAAVLSNGNLTLTGPVLNGTAIATIGKSTGKWYWEVTLGAGLQSGVGLALVNAAAAGYLGQVSNAWGYYGDTGTVYTNNIGGSTLATAAAGSVLGFALDLAGGQTLALYKNGVSIGNIATGIPTSTTFYPAAGGNTSTPSNCTANFGAVAFAYTPPSGYLPL